MRASLRTAPLPLSPNPRAARAPVPLGLRWTLVLAVRFYRGEISPSLPPGCRFEPSCSAYAEEALTRRSLEIGRAHV